MRHLAAAAMLLGIAALVTAPLPARAADPARVTLDGEWQLDRSEHDACMVVVPPLLGGLMHLEADFERGTVEGWLRGDGSGSYTLPRRCDRLNPTEYELARPTTYEAELAVVEMTFSGRLDPQTGEFEVEGDLWIEGSGSRAAPDYQYSCVPGGLTTSCPLFEFVNEWTGAISGAVQGTGVNRGEIDWPIPYCGAISPTAQGATDDWNPEGCPTVGRWQANVTEVVWQENEPPQINGIGATPVEATSDDTVVVAVDATDPDDDPLTYTWSIDGVELAGSGVSVTWTHPTPGPHVIRVTVSDGAETVDASLDDFLVAEPADAGDSGGVPGDSSGAEPGEEATVSSVANPPAGSEENAFSAQSGDGDADEEGEWSPLGIAITILFAVLMAIALGLPLRAAVAMALASDIPEDWLGGGQLPTARETATLAQEVQLGLSGEPPTVTVASPVQPRSSPDPEAPPAEFVLQPGQPYTMLGGEGAGPNDWVQVRQGDNVGWVHRSTLQDWHREVIVRPHPPTAGDYRESVGFPHNFETRDPGSVNYTRQLPGNYQLGPPDAGGHRPVYNSTGQLIGDIPADKVPSPSLTKDVAPPSPPPPPPTP